MSSAVLVSTGFLLGILVALGVVVVRRRARRDQSGEAVEYERLLADIDEAVAFHRADGTVVFANSAFCDLVGTDPEGRSIDAALADLPELQRHVAGEGEGVAAVESGDDTAYYDVSLYAADEEAGGRLVLFHDVTAQHERRCTLEKQNERLDRFASLVSHDLRNPLDVAIGRTNAVAETVDDPETQNHLESIKRSLDRMETIIGNVLVLARQGDRIGDTSPTALDELCEDCWGRVDTEEATLRIETDAVVEASAEGLAHVLENLFRNSVEHGSTSSRAKPDDSVVGTEVTVTVGSLPDGSGFYVEDDGPGIPESERSRVWKAGETHGQCGTGLGLAIVETISGAHGWDLAITESEQGGARFEFTAVETHAESVAARER